MPRERYRHDRGADGAPVRDRARTRAPLPWPLRVFCARCARLWTCHVDGLTGQALLFNQRRLFTIYEFLDIPVLLWHIRRNALRWRDEPVSRTVCASCCQWRPISGQSTFNDNAARPRVWTIATSPQDDLVIVSSLMRAAANPTRLRALLPHVHRVARALARLRP